MVLVLPNWFGLDLNDLVTTKMKWSWPKWIVQIQMWFISVENHNLDLTNSFWSWLFHFAHDQIILVNYKLIWSDQNHFGPTKTVLIPKSDNKQLRHYCRIIFPRNIPVKYIILQSRNFLISCIYMIFFDLIHSVLHIKPFET